ncbi:MAG: hypothetical protein M3Y22_07900, partial [Pseudomonadota bacterium]|nr:hypothetical protein [Pseudomonadota bacterium]
FMLARLVADGPARSVVDANCPGAGWHICAWKGRLPATSDAFLWDPKGPVWDDNQYGPTLFAAEANHIVRATLLAHPLAIARAMAVNTARQLAMTDLGDALGPNYLDVTVLPILQAYFPPEEVARFQASLQAHGKLRAIAAPLLWPQRIVLGFGLLGTLMALALWRRNPRLAALAVVMLVSLVANAFATGALSGPHGRYQARIAWLLFVPPVLLVERRRAFTRRVAQPRLVLAAPAPHSREAVAP